MCPLDNRIVKILIDHPNPFLLTHGGFQIQIEQTQTAIRGNGVDVEALRWWDDSQGADVIHYFGRPGPGYIESAHKKQIRVVISPLLSAMGSRSKGLLWIQRLVTRGGLWGLPSMLTAPFGWNSFRLADACIANTPWEAHLMSYMFGVLPRKVHVVPNGIEEVFARSQPVARGPWLICTATITERKRVLELARAAVQAQTPVWIVGKPYSERDPYALEFIALARKHPELIRYEGPIQDREKLAQAYRQARGFVLISTRETLSLSSFEAAACQCPMLLSDLPWARTTFKDTVHYCPIDSVTRTARHLREFYDAAPDLKPDIRPKSWVQIGEEFKKVYEKVLSQNEI